jgi:DNA-binding NarL/FixJ family response regulator
MGSAQHGIRVAVVEDHALVRDGFVAALEDSGFEVVHTGSTPRGLLERDIDVDVVLLDLDLGAAGMAQPADVAEMASRDWRVLVVSAMAQQEQVREFLRTDVAGFVPKWESRDTLVQAIRNAAAGLDMTSREVAGIIFADDDPQRPNLSERELEALRLYASGLKMAAVARRMNVSVHTAKEYIRRVRDKYAAAGRAAPTKTDLYREAVRDHLLEE